jgi:hypothetical protein
MGGRRRRSEQGRPRQCRDRKHEDAHVRPPLSLAAEGRAGGAGRQENRIRIGVRFD